MIQPSRYQGLCRYCGKRLYLSHADEGGLFSDDPQYIECPMHETGHELIAAPPYDPHRSTSMALTEARTVLSRARKALRTIDTRTSECDLPGYQRHEGEDLEAMRTALMKVDDLLNPWERW